MNKLLLEILLIVFTPKIGGILMSKCFIGLTTGEFFNCRHRFETEVDQAAVAIKPHNLSAANNFR